MFNTEFRDCRFVLVSKSEAETNPNTMEHYKAQILQSL